MNHSLRGIQTPLYRRNSFTTISQTIINLFAMLDLPGNNLGSHLGIKLVTVLGHESGHDETVHTDRSLDDLHDVLVKG